MINCIDLLKYRIVWWNITELDAVILKPIDKKIPTFKIINQKWHLFDVVYLIINQLNSDIVVVLNGYFFEIYLKLKSNIFIVIFGDINSCRS